jgi:hypothetical protein
MADMGACKASFSYVQYIYYKIRGTAKRTARPEATQSVQERVLSTGKSFRPPTRTTTTTSTCCVCISRAAPCRPTLSIRDRTKRKKVERDQAFFLLRNLHFPQIPPVKKNALGMCSLLPRITYRRGLLLVVLTTRFDRSAILLCSGGGGGGGGGGE